MSGLKQKVADGAVWVTLENFVRQVVGFVVGLVLARLLTPTDYGTVALLSFFFAIAGTLAGCGFGNALVQNKNAGDLEFNSVFYISIVVSLCIYAGFFVSAPWIAAYYGVPVLCPVTRVSALSFVFSAINGVQGAELSRNMLFKKRFKISLITCSTSAFCGIMFAYMGWGAWALVISTLITSIASVMSYWLIIAWRPKLMFSWKVLKGLFNYGWKLSASGLLHSVYQNLSGFMIGKMYTPADLAFVNKGHSMPALLYGSVDGTINNVSFPALAKLQDDKQKVVDAMRRMIRCSTFALLPLLGLLAVCAKPLILLLYGEQWVPAIKYVPIVCFSYILSPFCSINCNAISALGRSDIFLRMEIIKKTVAILLIVTSLQYGVMAFVVANFVVYTAFAVFVNVYYSGKLLGYKMSQQFMDVAPSFLLGGFMCTIVYVTGLGLESLLAAMQKEWLARLIQLAAEGLLGLTIYIVSSYMLRFEALKEYISLLRPRLEVKYPRIAAWMNKLIN